MEYNFDSFMRSELLGLVLCGLLGLCLASYLGLLFYSVGSDIYGWLSRRKLNSKPAGEITTRITDEQREEIITVLQAISGGHSDDPAHDAQILLAKMAGEIPGFGQSFAKAY